MMPKVLALDSTYETCATAIDKVFETFPTDLKGKTVCLKVNGVVKCDDPDTLAFVTNPRFVQAVIKKVESLGAKSIVVGDSIGTNDYGKSEEVFACNGLKDGAGAYYKNVNKYWKLVDIEHPKKRKAAVLKDVLDADVFISLPKLKTHAVTRISGGVKNNFGLYNGLQKSLFHYESFTTEDFAHMLAEIYNLRKPDLIICDGIMAMQGFGPVSDEVYHLNKVVAGIDGVAIDTVFANMLGLTLDDVPVLQVCRDEKLGETDLSKIELIGEMKLNAGPWHVPPPPASPYSFKRGPIVVYIERFRTRVATRPEIDPAICAACEACKDEPLCVKNCPSGALTGTRGSVSCKKDVCMLCTTCSEWCPSGALTLPEDMEISAALQAYENEHYPVLKYD